MPVHKSDRGNIALPWDYYNGDNQRRTLTNITADSIHGKNSINDKPLLNIEIENIILDELHLLMRVCGVLLRNLIDDALDKDHKASILKQSAIMLSFWHHR